MATVAVRASTSSSLTRRATKAASTTSPKTASRSTSPKSRPASSRKSKEASSATTSPKPKPTSATSPKSKSIPSTTTSAATSSKASPRSKPLTATATSAAPPRLQPPQDTKPPEPLWLHALPDPLHALPATTLPTTLPATTRLHADGSESWLRRAEEVPHCMREPFILGGYRPPIPHWRGVAGTLLRWHNQTGEIYTHLLPLIAYTAAGVWTIAQLPPAATIADALLFALYFGGVATCFACSALYHLGACHSELWHDRLYRVDRAGIVAPFFASMVFLTYYTFACAPIYRALHIGAALVTSGLVLAMILWGPEDARYVTRWLRVSVSLAMFSVGLASMLHMMVTVPYGSDLAWRFAGTYLAYGIGVAFYLTHWPERQWPGRFDMVFKSHQLWHVCVVVGAVNFYALILECFDAYLVHAPCR